MSVGLLSSDLILDRLQALAKVTEHTAVFLSPHPTQVLEDEARCLVFTEGESCC